MSTGINYLDETWNPITGCSHSGSPGCDHCWARMLHNKRHEAYRRGAKLPKQYAKPFCKIQLLPERLDQPLHWRKPRDIGVVFMGDWMHPQVHLKSVGQIWNVMLNTSRHRYFTLTKRPDRLVAWTRAASRTTTWPVGEIWPDHVFHGLTVCNQPEADEKIPELLKVPGKHWISLEPMLGAVDIEPALPSVRCDGCGGYGDHVGYTHEILHHISDRFPEYCGKYVETAGIDWVALGVESGPNRRYVSIGDMISVVEQCKAANVPCFVKQVPVPAVPKSQFLSAGLLACIVDGGDIPTWDEACAEHGWRVSHDMNEWPEELQVREKPE